MVVYTLFLNLLQPPTPPPQEALNPFLMRFHIFISFYEIVYSVVSFQSQDSAILPHTEH